MSDGSDRSQDAPPSPPTCRCGFDKDHYMVSKAGEYTVGGWISHSIGISTKPKRVKYKCRVCGDIIEETTDPRILRGGIR